MPITQPDHGRIQVLEVKDSPKQSHVEITKSIKCLKFYSFFTHNYFLKVHICYVRIEGRNTYTVES